ncbi:E3 ubiquitin-protein ligase MBR2-like isoform X1 [Solanum pennellii]|uniref:RING-type E3 ubiquitin transferase n=1 Tax=Solanum pennellii TaxID=28526 RepID=A0ABM1FLU2_SOLPN|nr:E3 ubiquitin-protein ligase MBR2-like isoform X1 [Solanum pennellii]XP_015058766.1 E3 ubiquitin-protein ligase MBR2-like isoform X1 [Solanum pennellii]
MQRNRSILDSFPETVDLNQGSTSSNASGDPTSSWDSLRNSMEGRLSNSMLSSARGSLRRADGISYNTQNCSARDQGESSSSANLHGIGHAWPSSSSDHVLTNSNSEERRFGPSNALYPDSSTSGYGGNHLIGSPTILPNLASAHSPANANLSGIYNNGDTRLVMRPSVSSTVYTSSSRREAERPASGVSYNAGTSSGSSRYWPGFTDISGSPTGWGLSCKRKVLESSSGQSCGRSSSSNAQPENIRPHNFPSQHGASSSLNISPASASVQNIYHLENLYSRNRIGTRVAASDIIPPLSASGVAETSARNSGSGQNLEIHDTVTFGLLSTRTNLGHSSVGSTLVTPQPISVSNYLGSRQPISQSMNAGNSRSHSDLMYVSGVPGGLHSVPRNVSPNSQGGSSSSLNVVSPDSEDEANFWSSIRNNRVPLPVVPAPETGNMVQDSTNWSLATSNGSYPRNMPSSSALSRGSSMQTSTTARTPYQNLATSSTRSSSEISPRTLLPPVESDFGSQRGNFSLLSSAASPVEEAEISLRSSSQGSSSRRNHRNHLISSLMTNFPSNEVGGSRGLASDIEGHHRLVREIRHVLHSMRRGENRQSEDYMMLDSFLNGAAEIHDTHRGMRLDVDNMSYEELLALEERIGNVNTGLSEGTILKRMRQRKHDSISGGSSSNMEPCCICREEYTGGDYMGILDCGHEFHSSCIKQWLMLKNVCPICKNTALKK